MRARIPEGKKNQTEVSKVLAVDFKISHEIANAFDRITKGKLSIPDSEFAPLNTNRLHILAVMKQNHIGRAS